MCPYCNVSSVGLKKNKIVALQSKRETQLRLVIRTFDVCF